MPSAMVDKVAMEFFGSLPPGLHGFINGRKIAEIMPFAVFINVSTPLAANDSLGNAFDARSAVGAVFSVPRIRGTVRSTQIVPAIVVRISVFMVDLMIRPLTFHDRPSNAVRDIKTTMDHNLAVAIGIYATGDGSREPAVRSGRDIAAILPCQNPGFWTVMENLAQVVGVKPVARSMMMWFRRLSHSTLLRSLRSGAACGADDTLRLRYFSHEKLCYTSGIGGA